MNSHSRWRRLSSTLTAALGVIVMVLVGLLGGGVASASAATTATTAPAAKHGMGLIPSKTVVAPSNVHSDATLPASVDLRAWSPTPGNQGSINDCTAWAVAYAAVGWYAKHDGVAGAPFAPLYEYSQTNIGRTTSPKSDSGAYLDQVLATTQAGVDTASDYVPQGTTDWQTPPSATQFANARRYTVPSTTTLWSAMAATTVIPVLKAALAANQPVIMGMPVYDSFFNVNSLAPYMETPTENYDGGHAVTAVGYDATGVIIENSWGTTWGQGGFGKLSWEFVQSMVSEAHTLSGLKYTPSVPLNYDVHGMILDKYNLLGGPVSFLGQPLTNELTTPDGIGRYNHFQGGSIYWTPATGAQSIHGAIRDLWSSLGWERSVLGYPTTDELPANGGRYNDFQGAGGRIAWSPASGAHETHGAIRAQWAATGYEVGPLGFPITNELGTPTKVGAFNHFQSGSIYWSPATGAHEVYGAIRAAWAAQGWENGRLGFPTTGEFAITGGRQSNFQGGYITWTPTGGAVVH